MCPFGLCFVFVLICVCLSSCFCVYFCCVQFGCVLCCFAFLRSNQINPTVVFISFCVVHLIFAEFWFVLVMVPCVRLGFHLNVLFVLFPFHVPFQFCFVCGLFVLFCFVFVLFCFMFVLI